MAHDTSSDISESVKGTRVRVGWAGAIVAVVLLCVAILLVLLESEIKPPANFPVDIDVIISEGTTVSEASDILADAHFVKQSSILYAILQTTYRNESVKAGVYRFTEPLDAVRVADAITQGTHMSPALSVTFPEGFRAAGIPNLMPGGFDDFARYDFEQFEGYLFPDTYFINFDATPETLVALMRENYTKKIYSLKSEIKAQPLTEHELITLASIIEREGKDEQSMRTIAGILLRRLTLGMPLQADSTLDYLLNKTSAELTLDDLAIDSPYNTYKYPGLPPGPISNPGLLSISAALKPIETQFLYYLTGSDGNFYYAETFEEHKRNKARYLR